MQEITLEGSSMNVIADNLSKLKTIFPEVFTEDKIDFEKLQSILGEYIESDNERYNFSWKGKSKALKISQTPSTGTLRPCKDESKNWDTTNNLYIEGDNLEVLKLLQKAYHKQIKLIYIDPPYNTGNDFVYEDDFKDNLNNYKKITGQIDAEGHAISTNKENDGRYHTNWLNMMYPRLRLARMLLKDNGIIFMSISDAEVENLKKICNEIFGEDNFVADIIWNSTKSVTNTALISVSHTHTLVYFKDANYYVSNRDEFRLKDDGSGFANPDNDPRGLWKADPFQVGGWRPNQQYEITNPNTGVVYRPNPNCSWKNDYEKFKELLADNRIVFGTTGEGGPQRKRFIWEAQERGKVAKTLWDDVETTTNGTQQVKNLFDGKSVFSNPKPVGLLKKILELSTDTDDIVLDFFSGSATTGHACMEMNAENNTNNRFILIQLPERLDPNSKEDSITCEFLKEHNMPLLLSEIGKERLKRAGEKIKKEIEINNTQLKLGEEPKNIPDIGFKVFKLDTSNIKKWNGEAETIESEIQGSIFNYEVGRSELDVVFEIMLKCGLDLTHPIEEINVNGKTLYSIGAGAMFVCMDDKITQDIADKIVEIKEACDIFEPVAVFKDNGFTTDSNKTNIKETLRVAGIKDFITV